MLRCLTLSTESDIEKIKAIHTYRQWIDAVEIRLDLCEQPNEQIVGAVLAAAGRLPKMPEKAQNDENALEVILTYRRREDGGPQEIEESQRLKALISLLCRDISYVDIEYGTDVPDLEARAAELGVKVIRSLHDFSGVPENLSDIILKIDADGEIPKVACFPKSSKDVLKMIEAVADTEQIRRKIVLGMGAFGFFTRVAPRLCGSMLTYCSAGSRKGAPGQVGPAEMEQVYRISIQNDATVYYGIIGNPVLHSQSPELHNRWFEEQEMNAVYLPFQVDDVGDFMKLTHRVDLRGFSITVPHKQNIIGYMDSIEGSVTTIGSCNTAVRTSAGWYGSNTDYAGFLSPLRKLNILKSEARALVIGAGGVARTVVYALKQAGLDITIVNRTDRRAEELAAEFEVRWRPLEKPWQAESRFELVVQTSSAGMEPNSEIDPLPDFRFCGSEVVYELIYVPAVTCFLQRAIDAGCIALGGSEMLQAQGVLQFAQFSSAYNL